MPLMQMTPQRIVRGVAIRTLQAIEKATKKTNHAVNELIPRIGEIQILATLPPEKKAALARNAELRNRHQGKRCFIIGNGPSLANQDLTPLGGEITMVMNAFWKHPILQTWQPTYYLFADPVLYDGSEASAQYFRSVRETAASSAFLSPLFGYDIVRQHSLLPWEQTYFCELHRHVDHGMHGIPDFTRTVPNVWSVAQLALMAAMYMGCSPIYVLGLDHDWLAHRGQDNHFYSGLALQGHPHVFADLGRRSYQSLMISTLKMWQGYEVIAQVAASENIPIFNATDGGFLDVFPRVEYASLLSQ